MFSDAGRAAFDHNPYEYFWRLTPSDDAAAVAMAVYAYQKGYRRGAAIFGNDPSSQGNVPNLLSAFRTLGGEIVINQSLALDRVSYRTEVQALIAAKPDVIFTEADPQTDCRLPQAAAAAALADPGDRNAGDSAAAVGQRRWAPRSARRT